MTIFDAIDNLLVHPQLKKFHAKVRQSYDWVAAHADLIVVASEKQKEMFPTNENIFVLPNAIDAALLSPEPRACPPDLGALRAPRVGYVGVMQERIDIDLITRVAELLPDHRFVFIGPELTPSYFDALRQKPNVHFLGVKHYGEIPAYLRHCDVSIMPHRVDAFTNSMNPLKIYEYLAAGKPIVSTPVAGTELFGEHVYVAKDAQAFAASIRKAIAENNSTLEESRRRAASAHTWERRVDDLLDKIERMRGA
jgi:glycosyltransferase involved in cell wall biosynthesis